MSELSYFLPNSLCSSQNNKQITEDLALIDIESITTCVTFNTMANMFQRVLYKVLLGCQCVLFY